MTTEVAQHRFDASIIGKEVRGQRVMLKLDWKLPGSRYEFTLYVEPDDADALNVGDRLNWSIVRGSLKDGKDGKYATDYFWDWDKDNSAAARVSPTVYENPQTGALENEAVEELFGDPRAQEPKQNQPSGSEKPNAGIKVEGVVQGHLEKLATDLYIAEGADTFHLNGMPDFTRIREIRDAFFHHVKEHKIMPLHYCYEHEEPRRVTKAGSYVHPVSEDVFCTESGLLDAQGQPVDTQNPEHVDDLPF